jgi:hypothetical protein
MTDASPTLPEVENALSTAHSPNASSRRRLSYDGVMLDALLEKTGAVPLTFGLAKQNVGRSLVMFSDFDFEMDGHSNEKLSSLACTVIDMLDKIIIEKVDADGNVSWYEGCIGDCQRVGESDEDVLSRKGYDTIWVWVSPLEI